MIKMKERREIIRGRVEGERGGGGGGGVVFFFNDTATTEIYTLSLHDALPISKPTFPHQSNLFFSSQSPKRANPHTKKSLQNLPHFAPIGRGAVRPLE